MSEQEQPQKIENDYSEMSEVFSDTFEMQLSPWSAVISFGNRAMKSGENNKFSTRVRMPLQQAKVLGVLVLRNVRQYEEKTNTDIDLPKEVLEQLNIPFEDWERFKGT